MTYLKLQFKDEDCSFAGDFAIYEIGARYDVVHCKLIGCARGNIHDCIWNDFIIDEKMADWIDEYEYNILTRQEIFLDVL